MVFPRLAASTRATIPLAHVSHVFGAIPDTISNGGTGILTQRGLTSSLDGVENMGVRVFSEVQQHVATRAMGDAEGMVILSFVKVCVAELFNVDLVEIDCDGTSHSYRDVAVAALVKVSMCRKQKC